MFNPPISAVDAAVDGLVAYLKSKLVNIGPGSQNLTVLTEWPAANTKINYPSVTLTVGKDVRTPLANPELISLTKPVNGNVKATLVEAVAHYDIPIQMDLWCRTVAERRTFLDAILFFMNYEQNTGDGPPSLALMLANYFNISATYVINTHQFKDDQLATQTQERRCMISLLVTTKECISKAVPTIQKSRITLDDQNGGVEQSTDHDVAVIPPPPGVPTNLQLTAGDTTVALAWDAMLRATSYIVKRSNDGGVTYSQIATPSSNSFNDTGLTDGTTYWYEVAAVGAGGTSAFCTPQSATPQATWTPIIWNNLVGSVITTGASGLIKNGGATNWAVIATPNLHFTTFPVTLRFKPGDGSDIGCGFADAANNNLGSFGNYWNEVWGEIQQDAGFHGDPNGNKLGYIDNANGAPTDFPGPIVYNYLTDYLYIKVSASGVVTLWKNSTLLFTYSANATGKTLIPYCTLLFTGDNLISADWAAI